MANYLDELSLAFAAPAYPEAVLFRDDARKSKGAVVDVRDGFIVFAGPAAVGQNKGICMGVRARKINQPQEAVKAVKNLPVIKSFLARKAVVLQDDAILVFWPYVMKKPAPAELREVLQQLLTCLLPFATAFDGKCEDCGTSVREMVLKNGTPGFHCAACQQRIAGEEKSRAEAYAQRPSRPLLGAVAGIAAAAAAAVAWGLLVYWIDSDPGKWHPKLHLVGAAWIGFAAALAIGKVTGKATLSGRVLAVVLAFAGKMAADALFYALLIAKENHLSWSVPLQTGVLSQFIALKTYTGWHKFVLGGDVVLSACIAQLPWIKPPQFKIMFEPLVAGTNPASGAVQQTAITAR